MEGPPSESSEAAWSSNISIDNLPDSLLREIFQRIPCVKSLVRCKSVSHNWFNLISDPIFINCQLLHQKRPKPFALFLNFYGPASKDTIFRSPGFTLSYLSRKFVRILSSCNDLLLCYSMTRRGVFYICNPLTLQCLALPPALREHAGGPVKVGLLSNYEGLGIENQWKHKVVQIRYRGTDLEAEIFSFENGRWTNTILLGPYYELFGNSVAYNGVLHWLAEPSAIVAYDFDAEEQYRLISCPITMTMVQYPFCSQCLGVCCGVLRILELMAFEQSGSDSDYLTVWELEDYPNGNWNVELRISFRELVPAAGNSKVQIQGRDAAGKHRSRLKVLGIHPTDRDVVFLQIDGYVVSCNLESRELKIEATTAQLPYIHAFPIELQWWPTPIPTHYQNDWKKIIPRFSLYYC